MLHVRVGSPAAVTGQLAGTLATAAGVQNVVVQAGGARRRGFALQLLLNVVLIVVGAAGRTTQRRIWHWRTSRPPGP